MEREILVYSGPEQRPKLVGRLWARTRRGHESATFEYDRTWLSDPECFSLEPALALWPGPHHTPSGKALFGAIGDSAPDRWGRVLMRRAERRAAAREKRTARTLTEIDFLLQVDDETRQGALRFVEKETGEFLAGESGQRVPPLVQLPKLLSASQRVLDDDEADEDLRLLLAPGSSLGGARPKASLRDRDGSLAIAKFPQSSDELKTVVWESVALKLAAKAGIDVPVWRMESVARKPVLILRRFDRESARRIPFLSAMSMLGAADHETHSYLEIADMLRRYSAAPRADLMQLWRRIVFNVLIANSDDHLRNHAFLHVGTEGWRLSPAYDLNPVPLEFKPRVLTTLIDEHDGSASMELAFSVIARFGLSMAQAQAVAMEVARAVSTWRRVAAAAGLGAREIERLASAFDSRELQAAGGKRVQRARAS